jgi:hypothetical protein
MCRIYQKKNIVVDPLTLMDFEVVNSAINVYQIPAHMLVSMIRGDFHLILNQTAYSTSDCSELIEMRI